VCHEELCKLCLSPNIVIKSIEIGHVAYMCEMGNVYCILMKWFRKMSFSVM
jgi:hypothetical protein